MADKIVIHAAYPLWRKNTLVTLARAKQLQDEGHDVTLTHCANTGGTCAVNYAGNPVTCMICQAGIRGTARRMELPLVPLGPVKQADESITLSDKKSLVEGVLSGLISTFRLFAGEIRRTKRTERIKRRYYRTSLRLLTAMKQVVRERQPDRVEVFNGRHACSKFCLLAARDAGVPFNTLEVTARREPIIFQGHTAHDRFGIQRRILAQQTDWEFAEAYFASRRSPSHNKFAKRYDEQFTPPDAAGYRKRVTFFLSSQDEFASLGKAWKSPFVDAEVIAEACRRYPDYLFCIRFHPNQADIGSDVIGPFHEVAALPNTRMYYPTDTVNTYELINWSDVVVTFGSTVTVEACWQGKPAIMLGPSFYDQLEIAETPRTTAAFLELLQSELQPRDRENAARMASYFMRDSDPLSYLDCQDGKMTPRGFQRSIPLLTYLARYMEVASCRAIKLLSRRPRQPAERGPTS